VVLFVNLDSAKNLNLTARRMILVCELCISYYFCYSNVIKCARKSYEHS